MSSIARIGAVGFLSGVWLLGCGRTVGPTGLQSTNNPQCDPHASCSSGSLCCAGACTNVGFDAFHCGDCATSCGAHEFCAHGCLGATFQNLCANPQAIVLQDGHMSDDAAAAQLAAAIGTGCQPAVSAGLMSQSGGAIDPSTGAPNPNPGTTLIIPGGSWGQNAVTYLESFGETQVYFESTDTNYAFIERSSGNAVVNVPTTDLTAGHDYFVIETVRDEVSSVLCFVAYGLFAPGTSAASWYFTYRVLPNLGTQTDSWMVVEWTDQDGNGLPDDTDTFNVIASGS